jgi:hypothetical protein
MNSLRETTGNQSAIAGKCLKIDPLAMNGVRIRRNMDRASSVLWRIRHKKFTAPNPTFSPPKERLNDRGGAGRAS